MLVDDRFLTAGSANLTNRSMGTDSELHVSWETVPGEPGAPGLDGVGAVRTLIGFVDLVSRLEAVAAVPGARLQRHPGATAGQQTLIALIDPEDLPLDPDTTPDAELAQVIRPPPIEAGSASGTSTQQEERDQQGNRNPDQPQEHPAGCPSLIIRAGTPGNLGRL